MDSPLPQLDRLFDYSIPEALTAEAVPGVRVRVPLRSAGRIADGYIVSIGDAGDYPGPLSELDAVTSPVPVLTDEVYRLARKAADRAGGSASDILRLAVPTRQARVEKAWIARGAAPTLAPIDAVEVGGYPGSVIADALAQGGRLAIDAIPTTELCAADDGDRGIPAPEAWVGRWAITLAEAATVVVASGRSAIIAVPDYRDQDQLAVALASMLPAERIVRLDARQSNPDRYRGLLSCLDGQPVVAIGNRSVVYAPVARLGLIALWDDGDPLHVEPLAPYVHARDAALLRQEDTGCALIFAGHSRSTEVERLVEVGWVTPVSPERALLPRVIATALQAEDEPLTTSARIPSSAWKAAKAGLETGPVLVQVARPGFAPRLACADCGQTARCATCEGPLATTTARSTPACRWCGALAVRWSCSHCDGVKLRVVGSGSERTADELGRAFPGTRVIIADGDHPVTHVGPQPALVIATRGAEPIAAGGYHAALLLDGERMIARESLRVAEDCLRWWSNAAALVAPRHPVVLVGVGGAVATALTTWRQAEFASRELADRRALRFPPAVRVATISGSTELVAKAAAAAGVAASDVLGPVPVAEGGVRTIVRFDYARGAEVAAALRAEVVRAAASRRKRPVGAPSGVPVIRQSLRLHLDDVEPFEAH